MLLLAVLLVQGLLVAGWFPALRVPGAAGGQVVVGAAAVAADLAVLAADETRPLEHVAAVLGLALLAALAHQLVRRDGRVELTASLTATGAAAVLTGLAAAWLALDVSRAGTGLLVLAAAAAAAAAARRPGGRGGRAGALGRVPRRGRRHRAGRGRGGRHDERLASPPLWRPARGGAVAARLAVLLANRAVAPHPLLSAALPAVLVAPAVYLLGRVLVG